MDIRNTTVYGYEMKYGDYPPNLYKHLYADKQELIKEIKSGLGESKRVFKRNEKNQDEDIFHEVLEPKIWPYWTVKIIEYNVR